MNFSYTLLLFISKKERWLAFTNSTLFLSLLFYFLSLFNLFLAFSFWMKTTA
ncbi:hypothetical protein HMPREF3293_02238 [Christensenella minuta]|uniref:Uncharacterized protein n=1 Tax=Christensenella minuta TaxID=626937 RepID=A0A136Q2T9_9FIRM|nr:hypothetical protein HMPREF3293_02238 [Christensenella minuta]